MHPEHRHGCAIHVAPLTIRVVAADRYEQATTRTQTVRRLRSASGRLAIFGAGHGWVRLTQCVL